MRSGDGGPGGDGGDITCRQHASAQFCRAKAVMQPSDRAWPFARAPQELLPAQAAHASSAEEAQLGCHVFVPHETPVSARTVTRRRRRQPREEAMVCIMMKSAVLARGQINSKQLIA